LCAARRHQYRDARNKDKSGQARSRGNNSVLPAAQALIEDIAARHRARVGSNGGPAVLIGLVGRGIAASRSPVMHQREGERLGMRYTYALIDFDEPGLPDAALGDVLKSAEAAGFAGVNVTHPFKQGVIAYLSDLAPEASAIGAVNTVVFSGGRRIGHNTDCWGFAESFRQSMAGCGLRSVLQFGAGGGGAAVGHALLELGAEALDIYDPDEKRATRLADALSERFGRTVVAIKDADAGVDRATGIVNATPVGMDKYPGTPFDAARLRADQWVADIVYFPADTALLRQARTIGCRALAGTGMAVFQAVKAFELFTGVVPDRDAMIRHFEAAA
jgi:shikimate dehydrogenase